MQGGPLLRAPPSAERELPGLESEGWQQRAVELEGRELGRWLNDALRALASAETAAEVVGWGWPRACGPYISRACGRGQALSKPAAPAVSQHVPHRANHANTLSWTTMCA